MTLSGEPASPGTLVTAKSGDKAARFLTLPPWAIYPMKPDACALLTCNLFIFHAHSADRITEALEQRTCRHGGSQRPRAHATSRPASLCCKSPSSAGSRRSTGQS
jgi:hypothetical protein